MAVVDTIDTEDVELEQAILEDETQHLVHQRLAHIKTSVWKANIVVEPVAARLDVHCCLLKQYTGVIQGTDVCAEAGVT